MKSMFNFWKKLHVLKNDELAKKYGIEIQINFNDEKKFKRYLKDIGDRNFNKTKEEVIEILGQCDFIDDLPF